MCKGTSQLERVARAICEQALYERQGHSSDPRRIDCLWVDYVRQAGAAIEALNGDEDAIAARRAARESWDGLFFKR